MGKISAGRSRRHQYKETAVCLEKKKNIHSHYEMRVPNLKFYWQSFLWKCCIQMHVHHSSHHTDVLFPNFIFVRLLLWGKACRCFPYLFTCSYVWPLPVRSWRTVALPKISLQSFLWRDLNTFSLRSKMMNFSREMCLRPESWLLGHLWKNSQDVN